MQNLNQETQNNKIHMKYFGLENPDHDKKQEEEIQLKIKFQSYENLILLNENLLKYLQNDMRKFRPQRKIFMEQLAIFLTENLKSQIEIIRYEIVYCWLDLYFINIKSKIYADKKLVLEDKLKTILENIKLCKNKNDQSYQQGLGFFRNQISDHLGKNFGEIKQKELLQKYKSLQKFDPSDLQQNQNIDYKFLPDFNPECSQFMQKSEKTIQILKDQEFLDNSLINLEKDNNKSILQIFSQKNLQYLKPFANQSVLYIINFQFSNNNNSNIKKSNKEKIIQQEKEKNNNNSLIQKSYPIIKIGYTNNIFRRMSEHLKNKDYTDFYIIDILPQFEYKDEKKFHQFMTSNLPNLKTKQSEKDLETYFYINEEFIQFVRDWFHLQMILNVNAFMANPKYKTQVQSYLEKEQGLSNVSQEQSINQNSNNSKQNINQQQQIDNNKQNINSQQQIDNTSNNNQINNIQQQIDTNQIDNSKSQFVKIEENNIKDMIIEGSSSLNIKNYYQIIQDNNKQQQEDDNSQQKKQIQKKQNQKKQSKMDIQQPKKSEEETLKPKEKIIDLKNNDSEQQNLQLNSQNQENPKLKTKTQKKQKTDQKKEEPQQEKVNDQKSEIQQQQEVQQQIKFMCKCKKEYVNLKNLIKHQEKCDLNKNSKQQSQQKQQKD